MPRRRALPFFLVTAMVVGCDREEDIGSPPVVHSLMLSADGVSVGTLSTITGTLAFSDADGDVEEARIELFDPAGNGTTLMTDIVGAAGMTEGTVAIELSVRANDEGTFEVRLVLIDAEANESDAKITTFEVAN